MEKRWIANPNVKEVDFLDIRIEKTERAIKQAFMELRAEKPLEKIRVKELCDRACINKSTFYAHYQDIYALANAMEDEMVEAVVASLPNLTARDVSERTEWLAREMFRAFVRHQNEINTLFADSRQGLFINRVEAALRKCARWCCPSACRGATTPLPATAARWTRPVWWPCLPLSQGQRRRSGCEYNKKAMAAAMAFFAAVKKTDHTPEAP